jgi:hypothetical protein
MLAIGECVLMRAFVDLILPQRKKEAKIQKFGYEY